MEFKIGDIVKLKSDCDQRVYDQFSERKIYKEMTLKIVKIDDGLGFEGKWETHSYRSRFFELVTSNRKERINNLFKEESND